MQREYEYKFDVSLKSLLAPCSSFEGWKRHKISKYLSRQLFSAQLKNYRPLIFFIDYLTDFPNYDKLVR